MDGKRDPDGLGLDLVEAFWSSYLQSKWILAWIRIREVDLELLFVFGMDAPCVFVSGSHFGVAICSRNAKLLVSDFGSKP